MNIDPKNFDEIKSQIIKTIKEKMKENNCTQVKLGELCNVSRSTIQKWCNDCCPTSDKLPILAQSLNVDVYQMLGIKNPYNLSEDDIKLLEKIKANPALKDVVERY